jgi:zinc protease
LPEPTIKPVGAGPFVVSTAVKSDVTAAAAREVLTEIDRIRVETVNSEELSLATSYLAGVFPIRYETTDSIARALAAAGLKPKSKSGLAT